MDRTGAAIIGASLMVAFNVLSLDEAYAAIDYNTIILLFGMMIVVANLIVVQRARRLPAIAFWECFKVGLPLTIITIAVGVLLLDLLG